MNIFLPKNWHSREGQFPIIIDTRISSEKNRLLLIKAFKKTFEGCSQNIRKDYISIELKNISIDWLLAFFNTKNINSGDSIAHVFISKNKVTCFDVINILESKKITENSNRYREELLRKKYKNKRSFLKRIFKKTA